ncbi:hypothetical protein HNO88_004209 [Novosphingobium chloroacetimidivorans]|uniref:Transmembrane protein n=1 Tax=Novosphingobium chloroacetimidivorans TaxID=1428314 RepID=A0A7W7KER1_9SPHN|nr:hypothetical protein [Novosphingobium chloroacetimidivorans]MBB4860863.1 hypothetical protein [Novosphingobium chloroacetimidivorans]
MTMAHADDTSQAKGAAVLLGRRYGDAMNSVPLLLEETDILQLPPEPRHRAFALTLMVLSGIMTAAATLTVVQRSEDLFARRVAFMASTHTHAEKRLDTFTAPSGGRKLRIEEPLSVALGAAKPSPEESSRGASKPKALASTQRVGPAVHSFPPYRNGTIAKPLHGEALQRALIEDRRLTREMNQATLRALLEDQQQSAEGSVASD